MELLIMKRFGDKSCYYYSKIYFDNYIISNLGELLEIKDTDWVLNWAKNPKAYGIGTDLLNIEEDNNLVRVYLESFSDDMEEWDLFYESAFKMALDRFIEMLKKWKEIKAKKPTFVIIKREGDEIFFYEDYREKIDINISKAKLTKKSCKHIFQPAIKSGLFYGGYHLKSDNEDIEISNKLVDERNNLSYDMKIKKDFTCNHAFFPDDWDKEKFKNEVTNYFLDDTYLVSKLAFMGIEKMTSKKGFLYILQGVAHNRTIMRIILNKDLEVVTCYPLFKGI